MKKLGTVVQNSDEGCKKVYSRPGHHLFSVTKLRDITFSPINMDEDSALLNVLPTFDLILSNLEKSKQKYTANSLDLYKSHMDKTDWIL